MLYGRKRWKLVHDKVNGKRKRLSQSFSSKSLFMIDNNRVDFCMGSIAGRNGTMEDEWHDEE